MFAEKHKNTEVRAHANTVGVAKVKLENPTAQAIKTVEPDAEFKHHLEWYLEQGFSVIPLIVGKKEPAVDSWKPFQEKKPTKVQIEKWFYSGSQYNMGVVCGRVSGNLVVLDFEDAKIAYKVFGKGITKETFCVKSGSGKGLHIYFFAEYGCRKFKISELALDVQGEGSYVAAAPSLHPSGKTYEVVRWTPPEKIEEDFEEWLYAKIKEKIKDFDPQKNRQIIDVVTLLEGTTEGARDNSAIQVATWYRRAGKTQEETEDLMRSWNEKNQPPLDDAQLQKCVNSAYKPVEPYMFWFKQNPQAYKDIEQYSREEIKEAEQLLQQENIIPYILEATKEVVGEEKNKVSIFLLNLVKESVDLSGDTASGKNTLCDAVLSCFPKESVLKITGTSAKVLRYLEKVGTIYFAERAAYKKRGDDREETITEYDIKIAISEGKLVTYVTVKLEGKWTYQKIETEVDNFITTTTEVSQSDELTNRVWELTTDAGKKVTKTVIKRKLDEIEKHPAKRINTEHEKKILRIATKKIREEAPRLFIIPYASGLANLMTEMTRARRDVEKLISAIYASAALHYKNRPIVDKVLICVPEDIFNVWEYMDEAITGTWTGETQRFKEVWAVVKEMSEEDKTVDSNSLMQVLHCSNQMAWKWLVRIERQGLLVRRKYSKAKGHYFVEPSGETIEETVTVAYDDLVEKTIQWCNQHNLNQNNLRIQNKKYLGKKIFSKFKGRECEIKDLPDRPEEAGHRIDEAFKEETWEEAHES